MTTLTPMLLVTLSMLLIESTNARPEGHYWRTVPIHTGPEQDRYVKAAFRSPSETNEELSGETNDLAEPNFSGPIQNVTVALGREAILACSVTDLGPYKVGWLKAEDQTILSLHTRVVTHNARVSVTHDNQRTWRLHVRQLKESDRGCYMCQINTNVMKKQIGCVDVHVPPDIIDSGTSSDITISEGDNTTLTCRARGRPKPRIIWRREDSHPIYSGRGDTNKNSGRSEVHTGESLTLMKVDRTHMGAYFCIASNDVPPAVSKRITLNVNFAPVIRVPKQLLGSPVGNDVSMTCIVEAYPNTINYWLKNRGQMLLNGAKHTVEEMRENYRVKLRLTVKKFNLSDQGTYSCVATNGLGKSEGAIRLYEIRTTTTIPVTTTTAASTTTSEDPAIVELTTYLYVESTAPEPVYREDFFINNNDIGTRSSVKSGSRNSRRQQQYSLSSSSASSANAASSSEILSANIHLIVAISVLWFTSLSSS